MRFLSFMSTPVGRLIRVVMGVALIAAALAVGGTGGWALGIFAVLPIATGVLGLCPINPLVGRPIRCDEACRTATTTR
jgi:hypothetical protein